MHVVLSFRPNTRRQDSKNDQDNSRGEVVI